MKLSFVPVAFIAILLTSAGCVSKKQYTQLQSNYDTLQNKHRDLNVRFLNSQQELSNANVRVKSLEEQIASGRQNMASLQAALDKCLTSSGR